MRTTLTLDDDVAALLARLLKSRKATLKEIVNRALRQGLRAMTAPPAPRKRFRVQPLDAGPCLLGSIDDVAEVLAVAEGDDYK